MRQAIGLGALAGCALVVAGCAGSGAGLDAAGRPAAQGGASGALTADFDSIQAHVFTPICTACHAGAAAPQGLRLDSASSYALLVGVPSTEVPSLQRVRAGDPDNSYIIQKLEGHAAVGARMPLGGPYLDAPTLAVMRQWISDGALPSPVAAAAAGGSAFEATTVSPVDGGQLAGPAAPLVVALNAPVDSNRLDAGSLRLERIAPMPGDAAAPTPEVPLEVPLDLALARGNPATLLATPALPLPAGRYRLLVPTPPATGLSSVDGRRLDAAGDAPLTLSTFDVVAAP